MAADLGSNPRGLENFATAISPGIDREVLRFFLKFKRLANRASQINLAIAKKIANLHHVEWTKTFIHLVFVGFFALLPPVNPIGTALILDPFFRGTRREDRKAYSRKIAFYCLVLCTTAMIAGSWVFNLFRISLPVVQLAGGILICRMAWKLLSTGSDAKGADISTEPDDRGKSIENILFYPLAFPMTTGAGTISVLLTLSARGHSTDYAEYFTNISALFVAILSMCISIYLCYAYTPALLKRLGSRGEQIVNGLSAFLVFCVGIQIGIEGLKQLIH